MDDDNLATACKHIRDGCADALGIDDGDSRIKWMYKEVYSKEYLVKIQIAGDATGEGASSVVGD